MHAEERQTEFLWWKNQQQIDKMIKNPVILL
jgi:hypothetical protein